MPILATARLPLPRSEDEFDDMVADALVIRFDNRRLVRFGRRGQRQGGIDGLDPTVPVAQSIVWQSTLRREKVVEKIEADLARVDARGAQPWLFVAALGMERDTNTQTRLLELSQERARLGKCGVLPLFWEDIRGGLCSKEEVVRKYFSAFLPAPVAPAPASPGPSDDAARWESKIQRMVTDWLGWCLDRAPRLINRIPIVRIGRKGAPPVVGFPELGRWDLRMSLFVLTHGNGGADTVRVGGTDVPLSNILACDDVTEEYLARLSG